MSHADSQEQTTTDVRDPSFLTDWDTAFYLDDYYKYSEAPGQFHSRLRFLVTHLERINRVFDSALEFGCGPVLQHAIALVPWVRRLDMADLLTDNLDAIDDWLRRSPNAFDWSPFIGGELGVLGIEARGDTIASREALMRERIRTRPGDITKDLPLGEPASFPMVASFNALEWVHPTIEGWRANVERLLSMLDPGGWLFMVVLHDDDGIRMCRRRYRCPRVTEDAVFDLLVELDFDTASIRIELGEVVEDPWTPAHRDLFVCAKKR